MTSFVELEGAERFALGLPDTPHADVADSAVLAQSYGRYFCERTAEMLKRGAADADVLAPTELRMRPLASAQELKEAGISEVGGSATSDKAAAAFDASIILAFSAAATNSSWEGAKLPSGPNARTLSI